MATTPATVEISPAVDSKVLSGAGFRLLRLVLAPDSATGAISGDNDPAARAPGTDPGRL